MKVGIMQGRLSKAPLGKDLDWFPFDNWEKSLYTLAKLAIILN